MEEQITLGFKDYAIIAYLVGTIICFCLIHHYLAKPETYRVLFAAIIAVIWPIPALLCVVLAIESIIATFKELTTDG
jgi:ABC-type amino acid transport system permease subunit